MKYNIAFIVGQGRSGTHALAHILRASPDTIVTIEQNPMWQNALWACTKPSRRKRYLQLLISEYEDRIGSGGGKKLYIDKSHPNLWNKHALEQAFPRGCFISIYRNPLSVVSSMMQHGHTARWTENPSKYGVPNRFIGTTKANIQEYKTLPVESRCALKWMSHYDEAMHIQPERNVLSVDYDDMIRFPERVIGKLCGDLGVRVGDYPKLYDTSDKWKKHLSGEQVDNILGIIRREDPDNKYLEEYAKIQT